MPYLYVIGDIHGNDWILAQAYARIAADAQALGVARPRVVLLGDYIDRGPRSRQVVDLILAQRARCDQIELRGNHDDWFETYLTEGVKGDDGPARLWMHNSPTVTCQSYGVPVIKPQLLQEPERVRKALLAAIPRPHREFFQGLALHHREGRWLFVHAGIDPSRTWEDQKTDKWTLLWNRSGDEGTPSLMGESDPRISHGFSVAHGHFRRLLPELRPGRLNLDTTAYQMYHLAVARIDPAQDECDFLPVVGAPFFVQLGQLLHFRAHGGDLRPYAELLTPDSMIPGASVRFNAYVESLLGFGRAAADPEVKAAADAALQLYGLTLEPR
jgi:serine/threonine protein phosphatase 1